MGRGRASGSFLPGSALLDFNEEEVLVSYRPPGGCAFSSTDTEGRGCDQAAWRSLIRDLKGQKKTLSSFSLRAEGSPGEWRWEAWKKSTVQQAGQVPLLFFHF